ncbi:MAG: hypothetical protein KKH92_10015 [Firmicutes bacterium]|nr:hypothetical protein [Bacillota bacterium]
MKRLSEKTYDYTQVLIVVFATLFLVISFTNYSIFSYSVAFYFRAVGNFYVGFILYIFISSLAVTLFRYRRHKKWSEPFLSEKSIRPFHVLILFIFSLTALYMIVSTIFKTDIFNLNDIFHISLIIGVAMLIIYIPSLFIPWIEDSIVFSFIYLIVFYMMMHIMLFTPFYVLFFVQGV